MKTDYCKHNVIYYRYNKHLRFLKFRDVKFFGCLECISRWTLKIVLSDDKYICFYVSIYCFLM